MTILTDEIEKHAFKWSKMKPKSIGRLAIYTNWAPNIFFCITGWLDGCKSPLAKKYEFDQFWKEWGAINFGICVFGHWLYFRYAYGSKTSVLPRWMTP